MAIAALVAMSASVFVEVAARYTALRCNASDGAQRRVSVRGAERLRERCNQ